MRILTSLICLVCLLSLSFTTITAQERPNTTDAMEGVEQEAYGSPEMIYINGGFFHLGTDVGGPGFTGWCAGVGYQTYLSDLQNPFFTRMGLTYGVDRDIDDQTVSSETYGLNQVLTDLGYTGFVRNYETTLIGLQANLGYDVVSLLAEGGAQRLGIYPIVGVDVFYYSTDYDALNANNQLYDFSNINFEDDNAREQVENILDGDYETNAYETDRLGLSVNVGLGFRYHFSETFGLGLEHLAGWSFIDKLDGYVSDDDNDSVNYTRLFMYFTLGD